jgi:hypothetical protein
MKSRTKLRTLAQRNDAMYAAIARCYEDWAQIYQDMLHILGTETPFQGIYMPSAYVRNIDDVLLAEKMLPFIRRGGYCDECGAPKRDKGTFELWGHGGLEAQTFLGWLRGKDEQERLRAPSDPCRDIDWGVLPKGSTRREKEYWHFRGDGRVLIKIRPLLHYAALEMIVLVLSSEERWAARLEEFRTRMYEASGPEAVRRRLEASDPSQLITAPKETTDVRC